MPISSPSYFPAQRGTDQIVGLNAGLRQTGARVFLAGLNAGNDSTISDLIIIGDSAGVGPLTDAALNGTIILGSSALPRAVSGFDNLGVSGACTIIGLNTLTAMTASARLAGTVAVGSSIASAAVMDNGGSNFSRNTFLGTAILNNNTWGSGFGSSDNVMVGHLAAARNAAGSSQFIQCTLLGAQAGAFSGSSMARCVAIGFGALNNGSGNMADNVVVGNAAGQSLAGGAADNVLIGAGSNAQNASSNNVLLGQAATALTISNCVIIGSGATGGNSVNGVVIGASATGGSAGGVVVIGFGAGAGQGNTNDMFLVETFDGVTHRSVLFGNLGSGNLMVGNTAPGANREFGGAGATNILKILNGTKGGSNPAGGGYFYVSAGALHYVGTSGTDTPLAPA